MTGRITNNLIEVRQGDSFAINIQVRGKCGRPVNMAGATTLMQVRNADTNALVFSATATDVDVAKGRVTIFLTPTETSAAVGDYITDIQVTLADGSVNTIYPENVNQIATFRITEQVTTGA